MTYNEETRPSRLRGDLVSRGRLARAALAGEVEGRVAVSDVLPGLSGEAQRTLNVLENSAMLVIGANVTGPWHYSPDRINTFSKERAAKSGGKFGQGTYLGVGKLAGETVDGLKTSGALRHDVGLTGNILAIRCTDIRKVEDKLRGLNGIRPSKIKTTIPNAALTDYVSTLSFEGQSVDAVMVYMDDEQTSAEIAVLPRSVENIKVNAIS